MISAMLAWLCRRPAARLNITTEGWMAQRCLHHGSQEAERRGGGNLEEDVGPENTFPVTQAGPMFQ